MSFCLSLNFFYNYMIKFYSWPAGGFEKPPPKKKEIMHEHGFIKGDNKRVL